MEREKGIEELLQLLKTDPPLLRLTGLAGSGTGYLLSKIVQATKKPILFLTATEKTASFVHNDLLFFIGLGETERVCPFPARDTLPYFDVAPHPDLMARRRQTLQALLQKKEKLVLIASVPAVSPYIPDRDRLAAQMLPLQKGEEIPRDLLVENLIDWGYERETLVTRRGSFAVRGGVIDFFNPLDEEPIRLEFFGDTVESIRFFDPATQKSKGFLPKILIVPPKEGPPSSQSFFDLLPAETLLILDDPSEIQHHLKETWEDLERAYAISKEKKGILPPSRISLIPQELLAKISRSPRIELSSVDIADTEAPTVSIGMRDNSELRNLIPHDKKKEFPLATLAKKMGELALTERLLFVAGTESQGKRFRDLFTPYFPNLFPIDVQTGELSAGFHLPSEKLVVLTEEEIFGVKIKKAKPPKAVGDFFSSFSELVIGQPIVHHEHGVGLYQGLQPMTLGNITNDFMLLEYQDGDKLYLPVYRLNQVERYVGGGGPDGPQPRLDRLGGKSWAKVKEKAKKAIQEIAGELLNLYAFRSVTKGFAFSKPDELYEAFEAAFPFEETKDQLHAIEETLADMESSKPMDRLIMGDVGYGKTEVAMRAAFKAVQDGKQVAVLVPTTILAFQHAETFSERFKEYPVRIEMLSRFRPPSEQKSVLKELAQGKVDIVIGTHRLLQPDISFKDLGLLIVDEEHRFGVAAKEKMKRLRKNLDVLSLSATPIPRTLYLSMFGLRSMSVIETPPVDRLAIRTFVSPYNEALIHEGILRELRRGGQIFFVHNRIQTIESCRQRLALLVPEAKIEIAHGSMDEEKLEEVMLRFFHHQFDILLCTTLIESGIDVPNANTIFLDRADRLGLAQIYQLRGRVGRGSHRAYCYLLLPEGEEMGSETRKRFGLLQKFSELGSGFRMASYDLEIRGAGNLLGTSQSGHMAALGYDLYTELLESAIRELKGETVAEEIDPELHFPIAAFLPEDYVPDPPLRLDLYRRLSSATTEEEIRNLADEIADRFGKLPPEAEAFLAIGLLKVGARPLRIREIRYDKVKFSLTFDSSTPLSPEAILAWMAKEPKKYQLTPEMKLLYKKPIQEPALMLEEAKKLLSRLRSAC
ncbi:MAG: transcription-repair coupling factor [Deltaproteobacteria bacterium]|nr:transcription-repair coupling factor [Deltaproteobacteria bacterium]